MVSIHISLKFLRGEMKKSRFKIWLRAGLFVMFGSLFTFYFVRDIAHQYFTWAWVIILFLLFIPVGFLMSRIVPAKVDLEAGAVTLSLDRIYFVLIWILVIAKLIASHISSLITISDIIMCVILGVMCGRLGGIGIRVRQLKIRHGLIKQ
jgi:hypothetical protein